RRRMGGLDAEGDDPTVGRGRCCPSGGFAEFVAPARACRDCVRPRARRRLQRRDRNHDARARARYRPRSRAYVIVRPPRNGNRRLEMTIGGEKKWACLPPPSPFGKADGNPKIGTNCFGMLSRETGHRRVPVPPHMITGTIRAGIRKALLTAATVQTVLE